MDLRKLNRLGVVAAKHCNLNCTACNHLSPVFKASLMDVEAFARWTELLARHVTFKTIVLQGGEPLLHPRIDDLLSRAKASGLAERVHVLTNGTLLGRMSDVFWERVDQVEWSQYPGIERPSLDAAKTAKIKPTDLPTFTESFSTIRNEDKDLVWKVKDRCRLFNRCFALSDGHFFKCIISSFIPEQVHHPHLSPATVDGVPIHDGPLLGEQLAAYVADETPLRSCEWCCGVIGKRFPQTQSPRVSWMDRHARPVAQMLEPSLLVRNVNAEMRLRENL